MSKLLCFLLIAWVNTIPVCESLANERIISREDLAHRQAAFDLARGRGGARASSVAILLFQNQGDDLSQKIKTASRVQSVDQLDIARIHYEIAKARIRTPRSSSSAGDAPFGMLELKTGRKHTRILLASLFVLEINGEFTDNGAFRSAGLTAMIEKVLHSKSSSELSQKQRDMLYGIDSLRTERRKFIEDQLSNVPLRETRKLQTPERRDFSAYPLLKFSDVKDHESPAWAALDFLSQHPIEQVTVALTTAGIERPPVDWLTVTIRDELTLKRVQRGIRESWKGVPRRGGGFGTRPTGRIECFAGGRRVVLFLNGNFSINSGSEMGNGFRSWTLAKVLNSIVLSNTGRGMKKEEFKGFAGQPFDGVGW